MLIQILPLKATGLANPIWESAAATLGRSTGGSISIDPGATLIALARYLSVVAVAFVAAALGIDRHRAERLLVALTTSTTLIALMLFAVRLGIFSFPNDDGVSAARDAAIGCAALGVILGATGVFRTVERWQAQGSNRHHSTAWFRLIFFGYFRCYRLYVQRCHCSDCNKPKLLRPYLRGRDLRHRDRDPQIPPGTVGIFCDHRNCICCRNRCDYLSAS